MRYTHQTSGISQDRVTVFRFSENSGYQKIDTCRLRTSDVIPARPFPLEEPDRAKVITSVREGPEIRGHSADKETRFAGRRCLAGWWEQRRECGNNTYAPWQTRRYGTSKAASSSSSSGLWRYTICSITDVNGHNSIRTVCRLSRWQVKRQHAPQATCSVVRNSLRDLPNQAVVYPKPRGAGFVSRIRRRLWRLHSSSPPPPPSPPPLPPPAPPAPSPPPSPADGRPSAERPTLTVARPTDDSRGVSPQCASVLCEAVSRAR
ncbi:hypothetical protein DBV15_11567 [Temnothorax longispinosus]|uniref:Uncharacterized protein n=1 Tax=Temnothorax longispinosus TaxID=300112 RepID=A0A4V3SAJ7_9HYME|nr:hypothetical protein DBV15_11567 [Temnothorax longispinosus]